MGLLVKSETNLPITPPGPASHPFFVQALKVLSAKDFGLTSESSCIVARSPSRLLLYTNFSYIISCPGFSALEWVMDICFADLSIPLFFLFFFPFLGKGVLLTAADDTTHANTFATHLAHSEGCVRATNFPKGPSKASGWGGETKTMHLPSGSLPSSCLSSPY